MADSKISALTQLTAPAAADEFVVVDKDDPTMGASGTDKRITWELVGGPWIDAAIYGFSPSASAATNRTALQAAVDAAGALLTSYGAYPVVASRVQLRPGSYAMSGTVRMPKGVELIGAGRSNTFIVHAGGSVDAFDTDPALSNNTNITFADLSIVGVSTTTAGIRMNDNIRDGTLRNVTIRDCQDNVVVEDCWTLLLDHCDLQEADRYNLRWSNATAATIRNCRIDLAGDHNVYISPAGSLYTTSLVLDGTAIQFAQKAGIYAEDVPLLQVFGGYFEGNNKVASTWSDIHCVDGAATRGTLVGLHGVFGSATGAGAGVRFIHVERGALSMFGCYNYLGSDTNYAVGVELGANVSRATIVGTKIEATTQITRSSTQTGVIFLADPDGLSSRIVANSGFSSKDTAVTIADDAVAAIAFSATITGGMVAINGNSAAAGGVLVFFRAGDASAQITVLGSGGATIGTATAANASAPTGTTGTDARLNLTASTDAPAKLWIENRTGASRAYTYTLLNLPTSRQAKELV